MSYAWLILRDYTFYTRGFVSTCNWYNSGHFSVSMAGNSHPQMGGAHERPRSVDATSSVNGSMENITMAQLTNGMIYWLIVIRQ